MWAREDLNRTGSVPVWDSFVRLRLQNYLQTASSPCSCFLDENSCALAPTLSLCSIVGARGLEPPCLTAYEPESYAATNYATRPHNVYSTTNVLRVGIGHKLLLSVALATPPHSLRRSGFRFPLPKENARVIWRFPSVLRVGIEPTRSCDHEILSLARLPITPSEHCGIIT